MSRRRFFSQLLLLTLITGVVLVFVHIFQPFVPYRIFSLSALLFFSALAAAIYVPASKAAFSEDKNAFTRLVMLFTFVKMFLTAGLVIGYHQIYKPENNLFLLPFFLTYIVFTAFETIYMSRLGKVKSR